MVTIARSSKLQTPSSKKMKTTLDYPPAWPCVLRTLRFLAREFLRDLRSLLRLL